MRYKLVITGLIIVGVGLFSWIEQLKPQYSGNIQSKYLRQEVEVYYDIHGIPHIYAQNEEDLYHSLGYVHAQDRLWQMDLIRRIGAGRLAEFFGEDLVEFDRLFRTVGIAQNAKISAQKFLNQNIQPYQKAALAYLQGINEFIQTGPTPIEYYLLQLDVELFKPEDIYLVGGYIAWSFAMAPRTEPIVEHIYRQLGPKYLLDLDLFGNKTLNKIPVNGSMPTESAEIAYYYDELMDLLPIPWWHGSNSWVIAPQNTESGMVILCNDTHMAYSQPAVWYEAHIESPGFSFYGNHIGGVPFTPIGHNHYAATGITMFENDDMDLYRERVNPKDSNQVWVDDHWEDLDLRDEVIKVKGGDEVKFTVRSSRHGPIINQVFSGFNRNEHQPISLWWVYTKFPDDGVEAFYNFEHGSNMNDYKQAVAKVHSPGFNIMYGDREGNIAWWTTGKLVKRPPHVNSKTILDGASGKDEPLGYLAFSENPQAENPTRGFIYSANNQPDTIGGILYPGYYLPDHRASRILSIIKETRSWNVDKLKGMIMDVESMFDEKISKHIVDILEAQTVISKSTNHQLAYDQLKNWNGQYNLEDTSPTIFQRVFYNIMKNTFGDELGEDHLKVFLTTYLYKRSIQPIMYNEQSPWWDDTTTLDHQESRAEIFVNSFDQAIDHLEYQLGKDIAQWQWQKVHTVEFFHILGRKKPLNLIFNVGPFPIAGSNEVINNQLFDFTESGFYAVKGGPTTRRIVDFADIENSWSVLPTGQSGNIFSPYYADQSKLYRDGNFRKQMMSRKEIEEKAQSKLTLVPLPLIP